MKWTDQIKDVCKISEVVGRYCKITKQSASKYIAKCPFHNEKTPSFTLDDTRNIFYCFGCKVGGDPIKFVQMIDHVDFVTSCKKIADWYGVNLTKNEISDNSAGKNITQWLRTNLLQRKDVIEYLRGRGLTNDTIEKFKIGWLPDKNTFLTFCAKNNITDKNLEDLGIKTTTLFMFENRIIFPILDHDRTIGFGGRRFYENDKRSKYINSGESAFFKKKSVLYGLARSNVKEMCIVEGYLDVCMCAQNNINAVSTLGTAITTDHLELAWDKCDEIAIWFHGDTAGQKAASKVCKDAFDVIRAGKLLSFINAPVGEDPASFLQGRGDFASLWNARQHLLDRIWALESPKSKKTPEMCVSSYKTVLGYADKIKDRDLRGLYTQGFRSKWFEKRDDKRDRSAKMTHENHDPKRTYEMILLMTLLYFPEIFDEVCDYVLSMDLEPDFFEIREHILDKTIDLDDANMLKSSKVLCTLQKLNTIAPFTTRSSTEEILKGWMEVFHFYCNSLTSWRPNERK